jgi:hypothetical protein
MLVFTTFFPLIFNLALQVLFVSVTAPRPGMGLFRAAGFAALDVFLAYRCVRRYRGLRAPR